MKLHLPAFLRKAVLACLAALAMPLTVGSGAAFLSSGALVSFALSQRAVAAYPDITSKDELNAAVANTEQNAQGQEWNINIGSSFYLGTNGGVTDWTINADLNLQGNVNIENGFSGKTQTFNGAIKGESSITWAFLGWANCTGSKWLFTGDVSQFAGNFEATGNNAKNFTLRFQGNSSNTGSINIGINSSKLEVAGATMLNSTISTTKLNIEDFEGSGSTFQVGMMTVSNEFTVSDGATVSFTSGTLQTIQINCAANLGSGVNMTVGRNTIMTISNSLNAGSSTVSVDGNLFLLASSSIGTLTCDNLASSNGALRFYSDGTLSIGSASKVATMSLLENSTLAVTGGLLQMKALEVQHLNNSGYELGGTANVAVSLAGAAQLAVWDIREDSQLNITLLDTDTSHFVAGASGQLEYQLFYADNGWWDGSFASQIHFEEVTHGRITFRLDADSGKLIAEGGTEELLWEGGDLTWEDEGDDQWNTSATDKRFFEGDSVRFTGSGTVTLGSDVAPSDMTVSGDYTFSGAHSLTITGALNITQQADVTIDESVTLTFTQATVDGRLAVNGTAQVGEDGMLLEGSGNIEFGGLSGVGGVSIAGTAPTEGVDGLVVTLSGDSTSSIEVVSGTLVLSGSGSTVASVSLAGNGGHVTAAAALTITNLSLDNGASLTAGAGFSIGTLTLAEGGSASFLGAYGDTRAAETPNHMVTITGALSITTQTLTFNDLDVALNGALTLHGAGSLKVGGNLTLNAVDNTNRIHIYGLNPAPEGDIAGWARTLDVAGDMQINTGALWICSGGGGTPGHTNAHIGGSLTIAQGGLVLGGSGNAKTRLSVGRNVSVNGSLNNGSSDAVRVGTGGFNDDHPSGSYLIVGGSLESLGTGLFVVGDAGSEGIVDIARDMTLGGGLSIVSGTTEAARNYGNSSVTVGGVFTAGGEIVLTNSTFTLKSGGSTTDKIFLKNGSTVELGDGTTLSVTQLDDKDGSSGSGTYTVMDGAQSATLKITAHTDTAPTARRLTFDSSITLELADNATQGLSSSTINGDVRLGAGAVLSFNNQVNGAENTFAGTLKGAGELTVSGTTLNFSGNVSMAQGDTATLALNGGTLKLAKSSEADTATHTLGTLNLTGNNTINLQSGTWSLAGVSGEGAISSLSLGGTLKLGTQLALGALTLNEGAALDITSLSRYDESTDRALIRFSGSPTVAGTLALNLNAWVGLNDLLTGTDDISFALFSGLTNWQDLTLTGLLNWNGKTGWIVEFENGNLVFSYDGDDVSQYPEDGTIYWNGSDGQWSVDRTKDWAAESGGEATLRFRSGAANVVFDGAGDKSITVEGTVEVLNMSVTDGSYSFSGGAITASDALTVTGGSKAVFNSVLSATNGAMVTGNSTLELAGTGAGKALGSITVEAGSQVIVSTRDGWVRSGATANYVSGEGSLVLQGILAPYSNTATRGQSENVLKSFLRQNAANVLNELVLRDSDIAIYSNWSGWLNGTKNIVVSSGASLAIGQSNALGTSGHTLRLSGDGVDGKGALYADANVSLSWDVVLNGATSISTQGGGNGTTGYTLTLNGPLHTRGQKLTKIGAGTLVLTGVDGVAGHMAVNEGTLKLQYAVDNGNYSATTVTVESGATLDMVGDCTYRIEQLSGEGDVTSSGTAGKATLEIANDYIRGTEHTGNLSGLKELKMVGAGVQIIHSLSAEKLSVLNGELKYAGTGLADAFAVGEVTVSDAKLTLATSGSILSAEDMSVSLSNGELGLLPEQSASSVKYAFGTLNLTGENNKLTWGGEETTPQALSFAGLSGSGNLALGSISGKSLLINAVENFTGTLSGKVSGTGSVSVGSVSMASGEGRIAVEGGVHVAGELAKSGAGSLVIDHLIVDAGNTLHMNYEGGALSITKLQVADGAVLSYSTGLSEGVIRTRLSDLDHENFEGTIRLDVWAVEDASVLDKGLCLGIQKGDLEVEAMDLHDLFSINFSETTGDFVLSWGDDGMLYLTVTEFHTDETEWDTNWGVGVVKLAPSADELEGSAAAFLEHDKESLDNTNADTPDFTYISLSLRDADKADRYNTGSNYYVLLTDGPAQSSTLASVFGGMVYDDSKTAERLEGADSFIYLRPDEGKTVFYHLLVGGSACATTQAEEGAGFIGNSHIQVQGGTVDYIIGGNHVTNADFTFQGDSYISVYEGSVVRGGIVGGSTLTYGSGSGSAVNEFEGHSHIYIYTVLTGTKAPAISDATSTSEGGKLDGHGFAAVVGGNAWIDLPSGATGSSPSFVGSSRILVDLRGYTGSDGEFEKALVGGNYTAPFSGSAAGERRTSFVGNAHVRVVAGEDIVFTGGISGASRRASGGSGLTVFTGDTLVEIAGGTHREAVAGGFWFDATADGQHRSQLTGNTEVSIEAGQLWRVVGGSYSLGGDSRATEDYSGSSVVRITGGVVNSTFHTGDVGQLAMAFVAGGNFYRDNAGTYTRTNGNTLVEIGGDANLGLVEDGIHIVGGDYANFSAGEEAAASISGNTGVSVSGGAIHGLVVGGSYLTDDGQGGSVSIAGTSSVTVSGGELTADPLMSRVHQHHGVAIVGGSMIVDSAGTVSGGHSVSVGSTEVSLTGGTVTGHVVGGNYSNESDGVNSLQITGATKVTVSGGELYGDIYGGHYSANTSTPDKLELHAAEVILRDGAHVKGNVVGGSYRLATESAGDNAPVQGDIEVRLLGGVLDGHVYAAGWNDSPLSSALSVKTANTLVELSSKMTFAELAGTGASAGNTVIVSGGYYKGSPATDSSVVTGTSELALTDAAPYTNLDRLHFVDFNSVSVAGAVEMAAGQFYARDNISFTKKGAGSLTLSALSYLNSAGAVRNFTGKISVLGGGSLILGRDQSVDGGLAFDISNGKNTLDTAYLQTMGDACLLTGSSRNIKVEVSTGSTLKAGTYYLADGFENASALDAFELVGLDDMVDYEAKLEMYGDNCLVLRVVEIAPDKWIWQGGTGVWDDSADNWSYKGTDLDTPDVYFNDSDEDGVVLVKGTVHPGNVYVTCGDYIFTQGSGKGGLELQGALYVGNEQTPGENADAATLRLELANTAIPRVVLNDTGLLVLADADALNGLRGIAFDGGVLGYAVEGQEALNTADVSALVEKGDGAIRIKVGEDVFDSLHAASVSWGNAKATAEENEGIRRILTDGLEKSGNAGFLVQWTAAEDVTVSGDIDARNGALAYKVYGQTGKAVTVENAIAVAENATVSFTATAGSLLFKAGLSGEGVVSIGSAEDDAHYELHGDNSDFGGVIALQGDSAGQKSILVKDIAALGGAAATLNLAGRSLVLEEAAQSAAVAAGTVWVSGVNYLGGVSPKGANTGITLQGNVETPEALAGEESVLVAAADSHHTILGSVASYTGLLVAEAAESVWTLGGAAQQDVAPASLGRAAEPTEVKANLAGEGKVTLAYRAADGSDTLLLSGRVGDAKWGEKLDLENATDMTVVIAGNAANTSTGALIATGVELEGEDGEPVSVGGNFELGNGAQRGVWAGSALVGDGSGKSLTLVHGSLTNGITDKVGMLLKVDTSEARMVNAGVQVDAGGTQGALFDQITIGANTRLSGVAGDITASASATDMSGTAGYAGLQFGASNIGTAKGDDANYLLGSNGGNLVVADSSALSMDFSNDGFIDLLKKHRVEGARSYAHVLSGGGEIIFKDTKAESALRAGFRDGGYAALLGGLSFHYVGVDGGDIMITGSSSEVYLVLSEDSNISDAHTVNDYGLLDTYLATVLDEGETLTIEVGDDTRTDAEGKPRTENNLMVNNLVGLEGSTLSLNRSKSATKDVTISLNNADVKVSDSFGLPEGVTPESLSCIDTEFEGTIVSKDAHVHLNKVGPGTLTVGSKNGESGGLSLAGDLVLSGGRVVSRGAESSLGNLVFNYEAEAASATGEERGYIVRGGVTTVSGSIREQGAYTDDNLIQLEQGGTLLLTGASELAGTAITASEGGQLSIDGGELSLSNLSTLAEADVKLTNGGALKLAGGALMEAGAVSISEASVLSVGDSVDNTAANLSGDGTLAGAGGSLALKSSSLFTGRFEGTGTLVVRKGTGEGQNVLTLKDVTTDGKWNLTNYDSLVIDVKDSNRSMTFGALTLDSGSTTSLLYNSDTPGSKNLLHLDTLEAEKGAELIVKSTGNQVISDTHLQLGTVQNNTGSLAGVKLEGLPFLHYTGTLQWKDGELFLDLTLRSENGFALPNMEKNALAGAQLFWAATGPLGKGELDEDSQLGKMYDALTFYHDHKEDAAMRGMLSRTLAAGAGASVGTLGSALSQDMQRQLSALRTRTTSMGSDVSPNVRPGTRNYSMWVNGEAGYHKLDADGLAPGYTLNGWGGTVGMNVDLAPGTTVGVALSAMYNDLKTDSADNGRGDLDTTYLSFFGRKANGAWMHTIVLSAGVADVSLNRSVTHMNGGYSTTGSTDGYALGLLYEIGYSKMMNAEGSFILQPVFNVELRHAGVKGYTETGSDAGLRVDDITQNVLTFGLGGRLQRIVGENVYNRASVFEARFLLKADAGDTRGKADNALINGAACTARVESAEVGPVGIEVGAGLSIPFGLKAGTFFMDASLELRKGYSSVDANVGYRLNF